ncbi:hypothetical protein ACNF42_07495 [Cuniculiplasma sp. SKW3]|uniref:hypothetical protein n=1 Tax=Cuniculiplasma sp. SKW3 TaxID=3400170 RepID=UPI003FD0637B
MSESPETPQVQNEAIAQSVKYETKAPDSSEVKPQFNHSVKVSIDYFFFLVSFLAVIIFSMTPLLSKALPELTLFAKVVVPLVVLGVFFAFVGTHIEIIMLKQTYNLHISDIFFLIILLIELFFVSYYIYL